MDYYYQDGEKSELLRTCDALKDHRTEIAAFFADHPGRRERGDFIKSFFNNTYVEMILSNGQRAGYRAWDDVLTLWRGAYLSREREVFMRWPTVADSIYGMILLDQWLAPDERPLPSEAEQISFIEQAEAEKASAFTIPQEAIDYILCGGSGVSEGKYRIFEQFQKNEGKQENIKFLRDEYGIGGHSDAIPGSGYWEDHDGKGITISRDYGDPNGKFLLSWAKVEKRIGELIAADRYLNRAEKEHYPEYQAQVEARKARWKIADEIRSIIDDYVDFKTQLGEKEQCAEVLFARTCTHSFGVGDKKNYVLTMEGSFVLPTLRDAMQTIIKDNTHLTERCEAMLAELNGPLAAPLEPTYEELNPPPPPKKEYRFALGDTVYLGTQEYELLAFDEQTVRLFDPAFPIINKELPRADFDRMLAENPLNDGLLQVVEEAPPAAEAVEPDTPQAVGRIDFLAANGTVGDSVEYTDAEQFVAAIKEENHVGTPMGIILYRDSEGQTIPQDFVAELDPPPQEFEVIDYAQARLDEAIELINEYCWKEFEQEADFSDLHHIDLAFGSTSDNKYVIEASADLIDFRLVYQVDGEVVMSLQCRDLDDLNVHLANLSFDNMIAYAEEQYEKRQEQPEHPAADTALPHERFTVIETENGYAVWDDVQGGIYVDSEGVQEEFTSEWQAEDYLKQVKRASAEKSAGSSADGRSSNGDIPSPQTQPRRYQVVVYHHIENGMDEKREYETLQEAENVARGYVDGTLEDDGFAYEGAAVYDLLKENGSPSLEISRCRNPLPKKRKSCRRPQLNTRVWRR